jgi:hypothetical protein
LFRSSKTSRLAIYAIRLFLFVAAEVWGQGGPPLLTDDPGTPGPGRWEVNVAFLLDRSSERHEIAAPLVDANYGWGERVQLKLEIPWVFADDDAEGRVSGLGNPLLGVKWRFLDEDKAGVGVSTYPQLGFNLVTSSVDEGLAPRETSFLLPVSAVKTVAGVALNVEAGRLFRKSGGFWLGGIAIGREFGKIEALAEIFGTSGPQAADRRVVLNVGGRFRLGRRVALLLSAGGSVYDGEGPHHVLVYAGLQLTTGEEAGPRQ